MESVKNLDPKQKTKMKLSHQTIEGLRMTGIDDLKLHFSEFLQGGIRLYIYSISAWIIIYLVNSFVELTKYLLVNTGAKFILSERFNQDPLECHFGKHRQMKGGNENPTVAQFNSNENSLRLLGSQALAPVSGNSKRSGYTQETDDTPLPKRPRRITKQSLHVDAQNLIIQ